MGLIRSTIIGVSAWWMMVILEVKPQVAIGVGIFAAFLSESMIQASAKSHLRHKATSLETELNIAIGQITDMKRLAILSSLTLILMASVKRSTLSWANAIVTLTSNKNLQPGKYTARLLPPALLALLRLHHWCNALFSSLRPTLVPMRLMHFHVSHLATIRSHVAGLIQLFLGTLFGLGKCHCSKCRI